MDDVKAKLVEWLECELSNLPTKITAVYIEYDDPLTADKPLSFFMFGFETLADGKYDPENPDHTYLLGDFTWEGKFGPRFFGRDSKDWAKSARSAVESASVQKLIKARRLQFIIGEHDGTPEVINQ